METKHSVITIFDATRICNKPVLEIAMELRQRIQEKSNVDCLHYLLRQKNNVKIHRRAYKNSNRSIFLVNGVESEDFLKELIEEGKKEPKDLSLILLNEFPINDLGYLSKVSSKTKPITQPPVVYKMYIPENLSLHRRKKVISKMVDDFLKIF
jgi:hypothetical protein